MKSPIWFCAKYLLAILVMVAVPLAWWDKGAAISFASGGIIYILPHLYFVHYAFRYSGFTCSHIVARSFSWGQSGKFALVALGFIFVYRIADTVNDVALFLGFFSMIVVNWFVAVLLVKQRDEDGQTIQ